MIVTCSQCEARYAVDPLAIGPNGRTVQCARCSHRWFQRVEGPKPVPDLVIRPTTPGASLPVPVVAPAKPRWGKRFAIAGVLVVIAAAGVGAFLYRDKLLALRPFGLGFDMSTRSAGSVARAPAPAARATATASEAKADAVASTPSVAAPGPAQLEIDLAASRIELVDGRYVVHGEITNRGGSAGSVSKLVVTFKKGSEILDTRTYPLALGPIAAGDRQSFSQALDNPPAGATDVVPSLE
ncbi:MJ0042 family finger-like domain-containing protein [Enhydrobacter aerosaccus]|uniref:MJ0042 family finger-like domain-containing protein n=1 Tax=Enhydrobacter aerosaccus TaxID=225324 RepID=A0A1T4JXI9_9HYPH|nr:zinc-ribbon domain-containing protein [Enhydrobacter aerosaccus]SJZ34819.1 MJ0042 family finger-like domain-containing protein [Enhydrobacter aerosaccus]